MPEPNHGRYRWVRVRAALALGTVSCLGVTSSYAYWTDSAQVSGTTLVTGHLDLKVNDSDAPAFHDLSITGMVPGRSTAAVLTVRNAGTVDLTYFATSTADGALGPALAVKITGASTTGGTSGAKTCAGAALPDTAQTFGGDLVGSRSAQRTLATDASETICIQATLPGNAASTLQNKSTDVALQFRAAQVS